MVSLILPKVKQLPFLQKRLLKKIYLRDIFDAVSTGSNFDHTLEQLRTRGYLEEMVGAVSCARNCLERFSFYFDEKYREESVEAWLKELREQQYSSLMPKKFSEYNLSAKDIFESEAFAKLQQSGKAELIAFSEELRDRIEKESGDIESSFNESVESARGYLKKLEQDFEVENENKAQSVVNADDMRKFITALEFTFYIFYAKAQFKFVEHMQGDVDSCLERLESVTEKAEDAYRKLGAPEEQVARVRASIVNGAEPEIQPFIDEKIEELKESLNSLTIHKEESYQLDLPLEGGVRGITRHKYSQKEIDDLLSKVSDERRAEMEKEFDLSNIEKLNYLRNKSFPSPD
jgi:hypothetical protein